MKRRSPLEGYTIPDITEWETDIAIFFPRYECDTTLMRINIPSMPIAALAAS
ncbi:MAG: hypothetical protein GXY48_08545 [Methanomicrobiales archaeon]|nr:hypothetical protein [Methanomicrobiales archaeon]